MEFSERSTKDALLKQLKLLQGKIIELDKEREASEELIVKLKAENEEHNVTNKYLKDKVMTLEKETSSNTSKPNVVKTDTGDILMLCNECEYPAEDIFDLFEIHSSRYEGEEQVSLLCVICNDRFTTSDEMTAHEEKHHRQLRRMKCKFCDEAFESKKDLTDANAHSNCESMLELFSWNL